MPTPPAAAEPTLAAPGAGLPPMELAISRIIFPIGAALTSWNAALDRFRAEGERVLDLVQPLSPPRLTERVLIERIRGIEDSSRFWSPAMVLDHLVIVGDAIGSVIVSLARGERPPGEASVAAVKPNRAAGPELVGRFRELLARYPRLLAEQVKSRDSRTTYPHPWFGELNARQWNVLAAFHQGIHRRQLLAILQP
jgi:DinB superfamily